MSGRCKHPAEYRIDRAIFRIDRDAVTTMRTWWADGMRIAECEANRCTYCGAWLPLGHSDETPERVAIEIRAAEIADDVAEADRLCDWTLSNEAFVSFTAFDERRGWSIAESSMREHSNAWLAGYLARVIATHKETP